MIDAMTQIGRLAMRVEGKLWVAYYALPNTMKGAIFLGSVQMRFVQDDVRKHRSGASSWPPAGSRRCSSR